MTIKNTQQPVDPKKYGEGYDRICWNADIRSKNREAALDHFEAEREDAHGFLQGPPMSRARAHEIIAQMLDLLRELRAAL